MFNKSILFEKVKNKKLFSLIFIPILTLSISISGILIKDSIDRYNINKYYELNREAEKCFNDINKKEILGDIIENGEVKYLKVKEYERILYYSLLYESNSVSYQKKIKQYGNNKSNICSFVINKTNNNKDIIDKYIDINNNYSYIVEFDNSKKEVIGVVCMNEEIKKCDYSIKEEKDRMLIDRTFYNRMKNNIGYYGNINNYYESKAKVD